MIKTLLLATSCVIGSGAGALQKNAPVLNHHYAITQTTSNNKNIIIADSETITNQETSIEFNFPSESIPNNSNAETTYNNGKNQQSNTNSTIAKINYNECYQSWNGLDQNSGTMIFEWTETDSFDPQNYKPYYKYFQMVKYTPYSNTINTHLNIQTNPNFEISYGQQDAAGTQNEFTSNANWYYMVFTSTDTANEQFLNFQGNTQFQYIPRFTNYTRIAYEKYESGLYTGQTTINDPNIYSERNNYPHTGLLPTYNLDWECDIDINGMNQITYILVELICEYEFRSYNTDLDDTQDDAFPWYLDTTCESTFRIENTINNETPITNDYEVVDIGGLMFDILTMPFAFVSQAFNLTIFPNTPYSVNVSQLFLAIFAALTFTFIIKKFIKK